MTHRIAVIMPTLDRTEFLRRAISWYRRPECKDIGLIVVDSSTDTKVRDENHKIASGRSHFMSTPELYNPKNNTSDFGRALEIGGKKAKQLGYRYCMHAGDDDFVLPEGIFACCDYMDDATERYIGCVGRRLRFGLEGVWGTPVSAQEIEYPPLHQGRAEERLKSWFNASFTVQFAAVRVDVWNKAHAYMTEMPTWYFGNEIYANAHMLFQGKVMRIPQTSVAFQVNPNRQFGFDRWALYDLIVKDENFSKTMAFARHRIREDFTDTAVKVFDKYLMPYLAHAMASYQGQNRIKYDGLPPIMPPQGYETLWEAMQG